jgi:hypothetical protein
MPLSPAIAETVASIRTERDIRLERLVRTREAFYLARSRYHAYEGDDDAEEERLCEACSKARLAFDQACERFFVDGPVRSA